MPAYKHPDLVAITKGETMDTMGYREFMSFWDKIPEYDEEYKAMFTLAFFTGARPEELRRLQGEHIEHQKKSLYIRMPGKVKGSKERLLILPIMEDSIKQVAEYTEGLFPKQVVFPTFFKNQNVSDAWLYRAEKYKLLRKGYPLPEYFFRHNLISLIGDLGRSWEEVFLLPYYVQGKTPPFFKGTSVTNYFHNTTKMAQLYRRMVAKIIKRT